VGVNLGRHPLLKASQRVRRLGLSQRLGRLGRSWERTLRLGLSWERTLAPPDLSGSWELALWTTRAFRTMFRTRRRVCYASVAQARARRELCGNPPSASRSH
jgi:hypothetical protein